MNHSRLKNKPLEITDKVWHKTEQKIQEKNIRHQLLTNYTSETTKQFRIRGKTIAASKEPDRKTLIIINDDDDYDVDVTKDADNEADEPTHVWRDRRTQWWRIN